MLFINSATLLLIDNAALLLISVKKEMLKLISGRKSIRDTSYLVLHFCSHSGSLKHWPVLDWLLTRLQFWRKCSMLEDTTQSMQCKTIRSKETLDLLAVSP